MHAFTQAFRQLRAHPGFNALIVALLALGIGANTTMFSLIHAVLLKPLPYPKPGELVLIRKQPTATAAQGPGRGELVTDKEFLAWTEAGAPSFQAFAAYTTARATWRQAASAEIVQTARVTDGFFPLLGVRAHRGRLPSAEDARAGADPVGVISYGLWQDRFAASDAILGQTLTLDGEAMTVVGVLPPSFQFSEPAQVWRPLTLHEAAGAGPGGAHRVSIALVRVLGRLQPGADLAAAQDQLNLISQRMWDGTRAPDPGPGAAPGDAPPPVSRMMAAFAKPVQLVPLRESLAGAVRPTLWLLAGAVGLVLLIACVNIANLQLARATVRRHELAVRTALGASRAQLARGLLAESLLPAFLGGALGIGLSFWGVHLARSLLGAQLSRVAPVEVNLTVAAFTLLLAAVTGLVFGLAPAWSVRRIAPQDALHTGGRTGTGSPGRNRWRHACVALEIALALALVANAGLLLKSYLRLRAVDLGFRTDVLTVALPTSENLRPNQMRAFDEATERRIAARAREAADRYQEALDAIPGVRRAALADHTPLSQFSMMMMINIEGYTPSATAPEPPLSASSVGPGYFEVLGLALRDGRYTNAGDGQGAPLVVVVNEAFARRFFPGQSVLGRRVASPAHPGERATVVGVVANERRSSMDTDPQAQLYFPFAQWPATRLAALIEYEGDPDAVSAAVLASLRKLQPELAFDVPQTLEERHDRMLAPRKLVMALLLGFAGAAVLLAALGIFGVMAYTVAQRTHEFGVRMALGADRGRVLRHVLRGAGLAIAIGVAGGVALGLGTSRLLESMLFVVSRHDPIVLAGAAGILALVGLAASLVPALRAARVNPIEALRAD
ncbi:MAG TPA: ABC transporter permease [Opitutaceae bacterium]|nr:ABC transporter permease [Opitutaceae bacterium]